jgi:hypothetical protein
MAMRDYAPFPGGGGDSHRAPGPGPGPHRLRIGDAERDAAAADLGEHYAAGRLTLEELHGRVDAVFAAKTFGQLTAIMADLPWRPTVFADLRSASRRPAEPARGDDPPEPPGASFARDRGQLLRAAGHARYWPDTPFGMPQRTDGWRTASRTPRRPAPADRAGRLAALSLLLLAMLIWLFTVLLFVRHGFYQSPGPTIPSLPGHFGPPHPGTPFGPPRPGAPFGP